MPWTWSCKRQQAREYLTRECLTDFWPLLGTPSIIPFIPYTSGGRHDPAWYCIDWFPPPPPFLCTGACILSINVDISPRCIISSYTFEGARSRSILSLKATLSAFCTATTAAMVELPLINIISHIFPLWGGWRSHGGVHVPRPCKHGQHWKEDCRVAMEYSTMEGHKASSPCLCSMNMPQACGLPGPSNCPSKQLVRPSGECTMCHVLSIPLAILLMGIWQHHRFHTNRGQWKSWTQCMLNMKQTTHWINFYLYKLYFSGMSLHYFL